MIIKHWILVLTDAGMSAAEVYEDDVRGDDWVARCRWGGVVVDYGPFRTREAAIVAMDQISEVCVE